MVREINYITLTEPIKWKSLTQSPKLLIYYGYTEQLKKYIEFKINDDKSVIRTTKETLYSYHICPNTKFAVENNNLSTLIYIDSIFPKSIRPRYITIAASKGYLEMVKFILTKPTTIQILEDAIHCACSSNLFDVFQLILNHESSNKLIIPEQTFQLLISNGQINFIQCIINSAKIEISNKHTEFAVIKKQFEIFQLFLKYVPNLLPSTMDILAKYNIEIFQNLIYFNKCTSLSIDYLATHGNLETIIWIAQNLKEIDFTTNSMDLAAEKGHMDVVKWLHCNRSEGCTTKAIDMAAKNGYLDIIKFLHFNRTEGCTENAIDNAAGNGHLEIVSFLNSNRSEGCSKNSLEMSCRNGYINVAKYLRNNRNEITLSNPRETLTYVIDHGKYESVQFIMENNYIKNQQSEFVKKALEVNEIDIADYLLKERKIEFISTFSYIDLNQLIYRDYMKSLIYIFENRLIESYSPSSVDTATIVGNLESIKFLHKYRFLQNNENLKSNIKPNNSKNNSISNINHDKSNQFGIKPLKISVKSRNFEITKYLVENNLVLSKDYIKAMNLACERNDYLFIRYLILNSKNNNININQIISKKVFLFTLSDRLADVQLFHSINYIHFDNSILDRSIYLGKYEIVEFLINNRKERCNPNCLNNVVRHNRYDLFLLLINSFLLDQFNLQAVAVHCARNGRLNMLKYLNENHKNTITQTVLDILESSRKFDILYYLKSSNNNLLKDDINNNNDTCQVQQQLYEDDLHQQLLVNYQSY